MTNLRSIRGKSDEHATNPVADVKCATTLRSHEPIHLTPACGVDVLRARISARLDTGCARDCWEWTGAVNNWRYGILGFTCLDGKLRWFSTHRVTWFLAHGEWPELLVLHRCDNPPCCNPAHLFLGTQTDNMADCIAKGRHVTQRSRQAVSA